MDCGSRPLQRSCYRLVGSFGQCDAEEFVVELLMIKEIPASPNAYYIISPYFLEIWYVRSGRMYIINIISLKLAM